MKKSTLFFLLSVFNTLPCQAQTLLMSKDFEADPLTNPPSEYSHSANRVSWSSGVSTGEYYGGSKSYLVDATFNSTDPYNPSGYLYINIAPTLSPVICESALQLNARVKIEKVSGSDATSYMAFGAEFAPMPSALATYYNAGAGLYTSIPESVQHKATDGWQNVSIDVKSWCERLTNQTLTGGIVSNKSVWGANAQHAAMTLKKFILQINGNAGDHVRVYIDDVSLVSAPPDPLFNSVLTSRWAVYQGLLTEKLLNYTQMVDDANDILSGLNDSTLTPFQIILKTQAQTLLSTVTTSYSDFSAIGTAGVLSKTDFDAIEWRLSQALGIARGIQAAVNGTIVMQDHLMYTQPSLSRTDLGTAKADSTYIHGNIDNGISITMAANEYEPAAIAIKSYAALSNITLEVTDLTGAASTIAASSVDIRTVKWWYQSGTNIGYSSSRYFVPELLLKNDGLVSTQVDGGGAGQNYVLLNGASTPTLISSSSSQTTNHNQPSIASFDVRDSTTLQPVDIPSGTIKQFWLTVGKLPGQASGDYSGKIRVKNGTAVIGEYPFTVHILPFQLADSPIKQSIYYRGYLSSAGSISSEAKNTAQYTSEIQDLVAHGVTRPNLYDNPATVNPNYSLAQELTIRKQNGVTLDHLYYLGLAELFASPVASSGISTALSLVQQVQNTAGVSDYQDVFIAGVDEPGNQKALEERQGWEAIHQSGAKVFGAGAGGQTGMAYQAGKIASWRFDDNENRFAADSSETIDNSVPDQSLILSNNNLGTLRNFNTATAWVNGQVGKALSFNGLNSFVQGSNGGTSTNLDYDGSKSMTFALWCKIDATETDGGYLLSKPWNGSGEYNYRLYVANNNRLWVYLALNGGAFWSWNTNILLTPGTFQHIAITLSPGTGGTYVEAFLNGALSNSTTSTSLNWTPTLGDQHLPLAIGSVYPYLDNPWTGNTTYSFKGLLDEVEIYNRALLAAEINQMYTDGTTGNRTYVGNLKDLHISAAPTPQEVNAVHLAGKLIYPYSNPFLGIEAPEVYRRYVGLNLWRYGYDGVMNYAYQDGTGNVWNDFDSPVQRDINMTYPTSVGVIDTVQWEGYREGVDDLRYIATLENKILHSSDTVKKNAAQAYLDQLKSNSFWERADYQDFDRMRAKLIEYIEQF